MLFCNGNKDIWYSGKSKTTQKILMRSVLRNVTIQLNLLLILVVFYSFQLRVPYPDTNCFYLILGVLQIFVMLLGEILTIFDPTVSGHTSELYEVGFISTLHTYHGQHYLLLSYYCVSSMVEVVAWSSCGITCSPLKHAKIASLQQSSKSTVYSSLQCISHLYYLND